MVSETHPVIRGTPCDYISRNNPVIRKLNSENLSIDIFIQTGSINVISIINFGFVTK